ncbi:transketolase family protein [Streptomyces roseoverticillatus]|uniref:transketolase family protein n=1 Tax=Streptomyces roseoverticillatus TaxID=66429 RepID=UPI0004BF9E7F|nr:transketolase C-terminal domain-containing protein [Streptomyces roseoverticillatus]
MTDCATAFSAELLRLARNDERICIVNNDSAETHSALGFQSEFPERFVDVGIAEQNLVGVSIGLANSGLRPLVYSASCFMASRALEQIKNAAYTDADVIFCGFVSGLAYGALGGTHHAVEDLAWMRAIPRMKVLSPATPRDTVAALHEALAHDGPVYIRIVSKLDTPELFPAGHTFSYGGSAQLRYGGDVTLIGSGLLTSRLVEAARLLAENGVDARVLHLGSIEPIDADAIARAARETGRLVVAEDHVVNGGLGGAVAEVVVRTNPVPVLQIGIPQVFAPIGPAGHLYDHFGLTAPKLAQRVGEWLR